MYTHALLTKLVKLRCLDISQVLFRFSSSPRRNKNEANIQPS